MEYDQLILKAGTDEDDIMRFVNVIVMNVS